MIADNAAMLGGSPTRLSAARVHCRWQENVNINDQSANLLRALSVSDLRAQSLQETNSMTTSPGNLLALEPWFL